MILALLAETTAQMISTMAVVDTRGSTRTASSVNLWKKWFTTKPSAMGTSTTLTMDRNMLMGFTSTRWPAYSRVSSGVSRGASTVETAVMPTDRATSPLDR